MQAVIFRHLFATAPIETEPSSLPMHMTPVITKSLEPPGRQFHRAFALIPGVGVALLTKDLNETDPHVRGSDRGNGNHPERTDDWGICF